MQNTREEIIEYLFSRESASIKELSEALHLTKPNIRHHINILLGTKYIVDTGIQPLGERGRPARRYRISDSYYTNNYNLFCNAFVEALSSNIYSSQTNQLLNDISERMVSKYQLPDDTFSIITRLNKTVEILNQMNYIARWESTLDGPILLFDNCPYQSIAKSSQYFCRLDELIISRISHIHATMKKKFMYRLGFREPCIFLLSPLYSDTIDG